MNVTASLEKSKSVTIETPFFTIGKGQRERGKPISKESICTRHLAYSCQQHNTVRNVFSTIERDRFAQPLHISTSSKLRK